MSSSVLSRCSISKQRWSRDVLQVEPAEGGGDRFDRRHDLVGILGVKADLEGVDAGELLEQHRLALHHRHRRTRSDVAQPQHRRPVGHDRDRVALDRVLKRLVGIVADRTADAGHPRRVGHREIVAGLERALVVKLDLPSDVQHESPVGAVEHVRAGYRVDRVGQYRPVGRVTGLDGDVTDRVPSLDLHQVDRTDRGAGVSDRTRTLPSMPAR
jgi:hypothetical protein